jgi:hypothetical protein
MERMTKTLSAVVFVMVGLAGLADAQDAPGRLDVRLTANGAPAAGSFEILPSQGGPAVGQGPAGTPLDVPAGVYDVKATLTEAIDRPTRSRGGVEVEAGADRVLRIDFQVGRVTLLCKKDGETVSADVALRRPGRSSWLPAVQCGVPFLVSGGTYEADVTLEGASTGIHVPRLQIMAGTTQRLAVEL